MGESILVCYWDIEKFLENLIFGTEKDAEVAVAAV